MRFVKKIYSLKALLNWGLISFSIIFYQTLISPSFIYAQSRIERIPVQFSQYTQLFPLLNPASMASQYRWEIQSGTLRNGGAWRNIHTEFLQGYLNLRKGGSENLSQKNVIGFTFWSDQEGAFLNRSRLYFNYAQHLPLNEDLTLSLGMSLGLVSFVVQGTVASAGGGSTVWDGKTGLWLYSDDFYMGFSLNQIFENELVPIEEITQLKRYANVMGGKYFDLSPNIRLHSSFWVRWASAQQKDIRINNNFLLNEIVNVGLGYHHQNAIVPMAGLENIPFLNGYFQTFFAYHFPIASITPDLQTYSLTINYFFRSKEN